MIKLLKFLIINVSLIKTLMGIIFMDIDSYK